MLEALTLVPDRQLTRLLRGIHRGTLTAPLTPEGLACHYLQDYGEPLLGHLRGLDARGVRAVVVAVLAERGKRSR